MKKEIQEIMQKKFSSKKKKLTWIFMIATIVLMSSGVSFYFVSQNKTTSNFKEQRAKVQRGSISSSIQGSGTLFPANRFEMASKVNATIRQVNFKEGDVVKSGDILVELDETDLRLTMDKTNNSILQTKLSNQTNQRLVEQLSVVAPLTGIVSALSIKEGDTINKGTAIATVTNNSLLHASFAFPANIRNLIGLGQNATLQVSIPLEDDQVVKTLPGIVTYIGNHIYLDSDQRPLLDVEITIKNPGEVKQGYQAYAQIAMSGGIGTSSEYATLMETTEVVKSEVQGIVKSIPVRNNQRVNAGDLLARLQNDDLGINVQTGNIKLQDLQSQLSTYQKQLDYYRIVSPMNGTIVKQDLKVGDSAKLGDVLTIVSNASEMQFSIPIDELDIDKVAVGQTATVTIDALTETSTNPLQGIVSKVPLEGTTTNGTTSYDVTISLPQNSKLRNGMSANAKIMTVNKDDVLYLPLEAVTKMRNRAFVIVKDVNAQQKKQSSQTNDVTASSATEQRRNRDDSTSNTQDNNQRQGQNNPARQNRNPYANNPELAAYYTNTKRVPVELGINNERLIEIVSGLKEGDEVLLPPLTTTSRNNVQQNQQSGFPGIGGMGGGFRSNNNPGGNQNPTRSGGQGSNQRNIDRN